MAVEPIRGIIGTVRNRHFALISALVTMAVFGRALGHELLIGDDNFNLIYNPYVSPPSFSGLLALWKNAYLKLYIPVTMSTWWLLKRLALVFGESWLPVFAHGLNLLVHVVNSTLVFGVLRKIGMASVGAIVGALIFNLHPVQTEPVVWATGLKDLLAAMFGLWALTRALDLVGSEELRLEGSSLKITGHGIVRHLLVSVLIAAAVLSKPHLSILPLVLIAVMIYRGVSLKLALFASAPWVFVSLLLAYVALSLHPVSSAAFAAPLWLRPLAALDILGFYFGKLLVPLHLSAEYSRLTANRALSAQFFLSMFFAGLLLLAAFGLRRRMPVVFAGVVLIVLPLVPVLGLVPFVHQRYSDVTDRYLYFSMLGVGLLVGAGVQSAASRSRAVIPIAVALLSAFALRCAYYVPTWHDNETHYSHLLATSPDRAFIRSNLAVHYLRKGLYSSAYVHLLEAYRLEPTDKLARENLLLTLFLWRHYEQAAELLTQWSSEAAANAESRFWLGHFEIFSGKTQAGIEHIRQALARDGELASKSFIFEQNARDLHDPALRDAVADAATKLPGVRSLEGLLRLLQ